MKINEIIKDQRKKLGLTQNQVAEYLGVSTPAVSKWESGNSYPDITQIPALARLLCVDLNTLLSFNDELTELEIGGFIKGLEKIIGEKGFVDGFDLAMEKIQEYPNCDKLICMTALTLDGMSHVYGAADNEEYREKIHGLYGRLIESKDLKVRNQALTMMIHKLIQCGKYEEAQGILDGVEETAFQKKEIQSRLYAEQGRLEEAAKLLEEKLMVSAGEIQQVLMRMVDIAIKDQRTEDAEIYASKVKQITEVLDLWKYTGPASSLQIAVSTKDTAACLSALKEMLDAIDEKWEINQSPLYRHIQQKENSEQSYEQMKRMIIEGMKCDEELDFLRDDEEFKGLLEV